MNSWLMLSQMAVKEMMDKYGRPDEATSTMLTWNVNGVWKRTTVSKEESTYNFQSCMGIV